MKMEFEIVPQAAVPRARVETRDKYRGIKDALLAGHWVRVPDDDDPRLTRQRIYQAMMRSKVPCTVRAGGDGYVYVGPEE